MKFILISTILFPIFGIAQFNAQQQAQIDSLKQLLKSDHDDTTMVSYYAQLTVSMVNDIEKAINYNRKGLRFIAKVLPNAKTQRERFVLKQYQTEFWSNEGHRYLTRGQYDSSLTYLQKSLDLQDRIGDTEVKIQTLNTLAALYYALNEHKKGIRTIKEAINLCEINRDTVQLASKLNNLSYYYRHLNDFEASDSVINVSMKYAKQFNNQRDLAMCYKELGLNASNRDNITGAIRYLMKSLKIFEQINDLNALRIIYLELGLIYRQHQEYSKAILNYKKSLTIDINRNSLEGMAWDNYYLGWTYNLNSMPDSSVYYSIIAKNQFISLGNNINNIANAYINLGWAYENSNMLDSALTNYMAGKHIKEEIDRFEAIVYNNIGFVLYKQKKYHNSYKYAKIATQLAEKTGYPIELRKTAFLMKDVTKKLGKWEESLNAYETYITMRDSLAKNTNAKELIRQEYKYQYEKQAAADSIKSSEEAKVKDAQLLAERAENKQHKLEAKQQEQQKYFLFGGLGLALFFGGFVFNRYRVTNKQKGVIEEQKEQVDAAYVELEEKNTEILDSINYAKRIQSAILPPDKLVKEYLSNSFVLYKPKDIVAGDFYWMEPFQNEKQNESGVLFAAADCTGHGVPGAMVSVVCNNGLNRSVREHGLTDPGQILDKTREIVISEFEKSEEEVKDGMDVALCSLSMQEQDSGKSGAILKYAGAHNPLWIIRKDSLEVDEIKANKQPIGKYDEPFPYTTHTVELNEGDSFYIFSDGYSDQFGGERGKKFKAANFKRLLIAIQSESMERQRELIDEAFEKWKGSLEQLDDVCVIGVRV